MQSLTTTVPRYLFSIPLILFGFFHITGADTMAGMVPIPGGVFWVYVTGVAHLAAAAGLLMKKYDRLAGLLLGLMLVIFALTIHLPNAMNPDTMQMGMINMLKDLMIAAGALTFAGIAK